MTPVVKLVFGAGYDKTRLTEFAAALAWAQRHELPAGEFKARIESYPGGLKAIVQDERGARRPAAKSDPWQKVREELLGRISLATVDMAIPSGAGELVLLIARNNGGQLDVVAPVTDARLIEQAIRKTA